MIRRLPILSGMTRTTRAVAVLGVPNYPTTPLRVTWPSLGGNAGRLRPDCPHCPARLDSFARLDTHLKFECEGLGRKDDQCS